jgi:hypothetical protein
MGQRKRTETRKKERGRNYPRAGRRVIEQILFDRAEDSHLAHRDCADRTWRQYTPNSATRSEPGSYDNSWILPPTTLIADEFNIRIISSGQCTNVKVHCNTGPNVSCYSNKYSYTWKDPCELPSSDEESNK